MISGAKGGGGSFKQTPDNLRSEDTFEGLLGLCVGPIKGPKRGLRSIKLDGTPIENETGELNFPDFVANFADGDPAKFPQVAQMKLGAGAAPQNVGLTITNPNDGAGTSTPGPWITRTLTNTNADYIDLRFIVSQLYKQTKKGIFEETLTLEIEMKPTGSTNWINPTLTTPTVNGDPVTRSIEIFNLTFYLPSGWLDADGHWVDNPNIAGQRHNYSITGKTTSPAVYELRINVPNEGDYADTQWDVRVRLLQRDDWQSGDDGENQEKRTISWESMSAVYSDTVGDHEDWRGVAWLQLYGKASDQLTGVPEVTGEYETKIVAVPSSEIYNPDTRQYEAGVWDGSWNYAFTNDPAWVINDAISDELSGLSLIASGSYLNKWDALELSKWCSELVPDGNGGYEPRYSLNLAINEPQKAEELIRYLGGAVGALVWDQGDGQWRCKVDKPEAPTDVFTLDNIEGEFVYSHTDIDTRYNDIIGKFINAEMDYREDSVRLYDNVSIAAIGRKPTTIALVGCTGRQEAMRRVKLRLRSTVNEYRTVSFTTNRRGRLIEPLSTILIADGDLGDQDKRTTGRITSIAENRLSFTVRDPLRLELGITYHVKFSRINPTYDPDRTTQPTSESWTDPMLVYERLVTNTSGQRGNVTTIYLDTALPEDIGEYTVVALEANGLPTLPKMYRVLSVVPDDDGERVAISAINVDVGKWDAADGVTKEDMVFTDLRGSPLPPTEIPGRPLLTYAVVPIEQGNQVTVQAAWQRSVSPFIRGYRIRYNINGGAWRDAGEQKMTEWELVAPVGGTYTIEVRAISRSNQDSLPLVGSIAVDQQLIGSGDITYDDGTPLEELKPAEGGATRGATPDQVALLEQLEQDTETAMTTIAALQSTAADLQDTADQLQGDVADLRDTADQLQGNIIAAQGDISTLYSTTATQGAAISSNADAISNAVGNLASLTTEVRAGGNPNLVPNSTGENGLVGWIKGSGEWTVSSDENGQYFYCGSDGTAGTKVLYQRIALAGMHTFTLSYETAHSGLAGDHGYVDVLARNSSGATVYDGPQNPAGNGNNWADRTARTIAFTVPSDTAYIDVRLIVTLPASGGVGRFRKVKLENGGSATIYNQTASVTQSFIAISGLDVQMASLTSTVATADANASQALTAAQNAETAVGTITSEVRAGSGGNMLDNTTLDIDTSGWATTTNVTGVTFSRNIAAPDWQIPGVNNLSIKQDGRAGGDVNSYGMDFYQEVRVKGNTWYDFSALCAAQSCSVRLLIVWFDGAGSAISAPHGAWALVGTGGKARDSWSRIGMKAVSPANAVTARVFLRKGDTNAGAGDSYAWFAEMQFKEVNANATSPQPYSPGTNRATSMVQQSAIAALNTSMASLTSTVSTQGATVSAHSSAISDLESQIATLELRAVTGSNMLTNSTFENGLTDWNVVNGPFFAQPNDQWGWGPYAASSANMVDNQWRYLWRDVPVAPNVPYTLSADHAFFFSGVGKFYVQIDYLDSGANPISGASASGPNFSSPTDFDPEDQRRFATALTLTSPPTAAFARIYLVFYKLSGTVSAASVRRVKFERGTEATPYSQEASVYQSFTALSTLNASMASLSSTVGTQGATITSQQTAITTLNGQMNTAFARVALTLDVNGYATGWEINNNGSSGNMKLRSDLLEISSPGGGARTEYSNGNWRVYDAAGTLRARWGVW